MRKASDLFAQFWSGPAPEHDRFTLEELKRLHAVLCDNALITDSNRELVVETLRSLAELMIWGDQHEPKFFDFFAEKHLLGHFNRILLQPENRQGDIPRQMLQTLSILIQNIRSETAIFYLFSNNFINELIALHFDFDDDEVLGYFVNLLKTISLKLTPTTVQLFFQIEGEKQSFTLYTEAIKFIRHRDGMVRAAVRSLTLNVYGISDVAVQRFLCSPPANHYFADLALLIAEQCKKLDSALGALEAGTGEAEHHVEAVLAEIEDLMSYCNDIMDTGVEDLIRILLDHLWEHLIGPIIFWPLQRNHGLSIPAELSRFPGLAFQDDSEQSSSSEDLEPLLSARPDGGSQVRLQCAMLVLERLIHVVSEPLFLWPVAAALLAGNAASHSSAPEPSRQPSPSGQSTGNDQRGDTGAGSSFQLPYRVQRVLHHEPVLYREAFLAIVRGNDAALAAAAVRVLAAMLHSRHVETELLNVAGLLPHRRKKHKQLLDVLTAEGPPAQSSTSGGANQNVLYVSADVSIPTSEASSPASEQQPHTQREPRRLKAAGANGPSQGGGMKPDNWNEDDSRHAGVEILDALIGLLLLPLLPISALWGTGYLILQLAAFQRGGADLNALQSQGVHVAWSAARDGLMDQIRGMWCDALPGMLHNCWPRSRAGLTSVGNQSTNAAVAAWLQAAQTKELLRWPAGSETMRPFQPAGKDTISAASAKQTWQDAQRFLTLAQLQLALASPTGEIPAQSPLVRITEVDLQAKEIKEGQELEIPERLPCAVAFLRNEERNVFFAMHGLPETAAGEDLPSPDATARCVPQVLLADPGTRMSSGIVLSHAPLMGADPAVEPSHPRWLHIHVRPPVPGLLKVLQASGVGTTFSNLGRQLQDGHWVLSFIDQERAAAARDLVDQNQSKLRAYYCDALAPLLLPGKT